MAYITLLSDRYLLFYWDLATICKNPVVLTPYHKNPILLTPYHCPQESCFTDTLPLSSRTLFY